MKIIGTHKNNNLRLKAQNFKVAGVFLDPKEQMDLRTLSTNTIINILEANIQKRETLFANTELSKKLNK